MDWGERTLAEESIAGFLNLIIGDPGDATNASWVSLLAMGSFVGLCSGSAGGLLILSVLLPIARLL